MKYAINEFSLYQLKGNLWHVVSDETGADLDPIHVSDFNEDAFTLFDNEADCLALSAYDQRALTMEWAQDFDNN